MRTLVVWGLLLPLLVSSRVLGRSSSAEDLAQLKSLLERFEETLAQEDTSETDYGTMNQEAQRGQSSRGWSADAEREAAPLEGSQAAAEEQKSPRNRLLDLLLTARKRASGCFVARMDRIGNTSGLGCNNSRG
ncbi:natriuretic peptides A [Festucalex cinctus]